MPKGVQTSPRIDWNDDILARLRLLWSQGLSTAKIGRRLGVSKNAIIGKAKRIGLPERQSPIRRSSNKGAPRTRQTKAPATLPPLTSLAQPVVHPKPAPLATEPEAPAPPVLTAAEIVHENPLPPRPMYVPPIESTQAAHTTEQRSCCWPLGDVGTRSFRFCDAPIATRKPYCSTHAKEAYVKARDRRENADAFIQ